MRAHIRAAFPSSWRISLYTRVRQPSGLRIWTQCKAKIRVNLSWGGEEKRQFCWQLETESPLCSLPKHKTQTPFSSFSSSQQILFLQRVSYLPAERSHKTQVVTKLTPLKIILFLFQKGYKKSFKMKKDGLFCIYWPRVISNKKRLKDSITAILALQEILEVQNISIDNEPR